VHEIKFDGYRAQVHVDRSNWMTRLMDKFGSDNNYDDALQPISNTEDMAGRYLSLA
jgi:N-acyl-L-homoserine lactone synthetase